MSAPNDIQLWEGVKNSLLQSAFENGANACIFCRINGKLIMANDAAADIFGFSKDELQKIGCAGIFKTDDNLERLFKESLENGRASGIILARRKNKEVFKASIRSTRVKDQQGADFLCLTIIDLGNELRLETVLNEIGQLALLGEGKRSLRDHLKFINNAIDRSPDIIAVIDQNGRRKLINHMAASKFGYSLNELKKKSIFEIIFEEDRKKTAAVLKSLPQLKSVDNFETRIVCKDGSLLKIIWSYRWDEESGEIFAIGRDTNELKHQDSSFWPPDKLLEEYLEQFSDAVFVHDRTGQIIEVNNPACKSLGYSRAELLSMNIMDVEMDFGLKNAREEWEQMTNAKPFVLRGHQRRKDGTRFPVEIQVGCYFHQEERRIVGLVQDITERIKKEEVIKKSEWQFRTLIDNLSIGVLKQGPNAEIILSNKMALELLGLTEDQLLGKTSFDPDWNVIHEDGSAFPGTTHPVPQALATQRPVRNVVMGVYRPVQKDRVWLLVNAEPTFESNGTMDCVICTFSDITAKKQIEEENIAQLRRYKMLLQTSQDAIFILDESGCIQEWNEAFLAHLGYTEAEIKGRHIWDWDKDQRWDTQFSEKIFAAVDERGIAYESMHQKKDGSIRNVDIRLHRFTINGINSYYASARDITENKRTEKKIKELNEELRALAVYMQNLIEKERSAIAKEIHDEFAQNFVALNMNAVWLKSKLKDSDESIQQVLNEQMNIANIVINTSRKIFNSLHPSMLDELGLIAAISWYMKTYQKLANINFELDTNIEEEKLSNEINLVLFRIFQECLTNISRYAKATKVRASIIKRKNSITMDIQDDGIGFDVAAVDAKTHHGLLVMRERIHAIDGKIRIDSTPGKGTSVQVELPLT